MNFEGSPKYSFSLGHRLKDIIEIERAIGILSTKWDVDKKTLFQLNIVLEELISDTMYYGFSDRDQGSINVDLTYEKDAIYVQIMDDAMAFDPSRAMDSVGYQMGNRALPLTQQIGEEPTYVNADGKNIFSFKIKING